MTHRYDMVLLHAPSVLDFHQRDDVLFAHLGNSDSVHVSPIFEMPPVGMLGLRDHLSRRGWRVGWFNVAARMLRDPDLDIAGFLERLDAPLFGIDLHWLVHAEGALSLARWIHAVHPGSKVLLGGHGATYYADELIQREEIDLVQPGYDTLEQVHQLLAARNHPAQLASVPDLLYKVGGEARRNPPFPELPPYRAAVDWGELFDGQTDRTPYHLVLPQAGCRYNCRWCGGSAAASRRLFGLRGEAHKRPGMLAEEIASVATGPRGPSPGHTITLIDFFHEDGDRLEAALSGLRSGAVATAHYSLHRLPPVERIRKMTAVTRTILELSPDSHDPAVAAASGRDAYSMEQMESFIAALQREVRSFEIYFMIGLPGQTEASVHETVDYCADLLRRFPAGRVVPFLCPMLPFLDPASDIFEEPSQYGYTLHHRSLEDHRQALLSPTWRGRLNYATDRLSRDDLVRVSYDAVIRLTRIKAKAGLLPSSTAHNLVDLLQETKTLITSIERTLARPAGDDRDRAWRKCKNSILEYNSANVTTIRSQQRPIDLDFASRQWFDTDEAFDRVLGR